MCLAVYVASPSTLPLLAWDEARPAFHVREVAPDDPVRQRFSLPSVYYLGSHQGCGCGFQYGVLPADLQDPEEEARGRTAVDALRAYVARAASGQPVEVFGCWEGEQALPALATERITLDQLDGESFDFPQRQLLRVEASPA